ncbi:unnamed protein product [Dracunculus medinensis]|uniref:SPRY domain-containing protein n=1 Tax=Dracunculus medinensis TaxID=318479 RepID=A0A0N4UD82_DRAME|nr:unnamed protein product [Dracunculus medinensis]
MSIAAVADRLSAAFITPALPAKMTTSTYSSSHRGHNRGDWNVRVGHDAVKMNSVIGKYGIWGASGERLLHFAEHELFVAFSNGEDI